MRVTTPRVGVAAALLALLTTVWIASRTTAQAPPRSSPTPWSGPPSFPHELDLASPPGELPGVAVPVGQFLDVILVHAPVGARYRLTQEAVSTQPARGDAPWEVGSPPEFARNSMPADCGGAFAGAWNMLADAGQEADVPKAVEALRTVSAAGPCRDAAEQRLIAHTRRVLKRPRQVPAGTRLRVTVERLAAAGSAVERTWSVVFAPGRGDFGWRYPTEQAWVAAGIAQDLAELSAFAAAAPAPSGPVRVTLPDPEAPNRLRIEVPVAGAPIANDVTIAPHVWAPELHLELAKRLQAGAGLRASTQEESAGLLEALTRPVASVLLREARRLSDRLSDQPTDSHAHEQASLLWCVFGLRESSGQRGDRRPALSRATAHLSFARALRDGRAVSREGTWAAILIATLAGRSREAVQMLDGMEAPTSPSQRAWIAAVRLRNDGDRRKMEAPASRTLLEQLEFVRAKATSGGGLSALAALEGLQLPAIPDWARITLPAGATIEEEQRFTPDAISLELRDLALAHDATADLAADLPRAAALLADREAPIVRRPADGRGRIEVLGPTAWSSSAARHVLQHAQSRAVFLEFRLGVPAQAEEFRRWVRPLVEPLPIFGLLETSWTTEPPPADRLCAAGREQVVRSPMEVPAELWASILDRRCAHTPGFPPSRAFFDPPVPTGTTLDARRRSVSGYLSMAMTLDDMKRFRELAPYDSVLAMNAIQREHRGAAPPEVVVQQIGPFADYQVSAGRMALKAVAKDPQAHRLMAEKLCALSADDCGALAHDLVASGDADGAAKVYERILEEAGDRVAASHQAQWLVSYYEDRGEAARAMRVARQAALVGSAEGMAVLGRLYERRGRLEEAERAFAAIAERYDQDDDLRTFYIRASHHEDGARYAAKAEAATKDLFPQGMARLPEVLGTPHRSSPVLTQPSDGLLKAGIRAGAVVVGVDGFLVENVKGYGSLKAIGTGPTMKLMIWQDGKYVEVEERRDRINYMR